MTDSSNNTSTASIAPAKNWLARTLVVSVLMFGFGYALVPLYDVFCAITGLGGRSSIDVSGAHEKVVVDQSRSVKVEFTANSITDLPWTFKPLVGSVELHPGEKVQIDYEVINTSSENTVGRAIPSVVPASHAKHLKKTDCFCFDFQPVAADERILMPVVFYIDPELPEEVTEMSLSYTFFNAADFAPKNALENEVSKVQ